MCSSTPQNPNLTTESEYREQLFRAILEIAEPGDHLRYPLRRAMRLLDLEQLKLLFDDVADFLDPGDQTKRRSLLDERFGDVNRDRL